MYLACISKVPCLPHFLGFGRVRGGVGGVLVSGLLCGINLEVCFMLVQRQVFVFAARGSRAGFIRALWQPIARSLETKHMLRE